MVGVELLLIGVNIMYKVVLVIEVVIDILLLYVVDVIV